MLQRMMMICAVLGVLVTSPGLAQTSDKTAVIYRDPNCGCCQGYADHLRRHGFKVEVRNTTALDAIKRRYNVPDALASCHTMRSGGYTVEGHVPVSTVNKLLREKPKISGIALPGMPQGSPGMPGPKTEPFVSYEIGPGAPKTFDVE